MIITIALLLQVAVNTELGYRLQLPDGFVAFPEGKTQQDVVDCWTDVTPTASGGGLILCIQRMRGTIGRERLSRTDLPAQIQLKTLKWKGFDIDGLKTDTVQAGVAVVVYAAQVPLKPEAIQLIVAGPREQTERAEAILTSTLSSLEGSTNWLTAQERSGRLGSVVGWVLGLAIALLLWRIFLSRRRTQPT